MQSGTGRGFQGAHVDVRDPNAQIELRPYTWSGSDFQEATENLAPEENSEVLANEPLPSIPASPPSSYLPPPSGDVVTHNWNVQLAAECARWPAAEHARWPGPTMPVSFAPGWMHPQYLINPQQNLLHWQSPSNGQPLSSIPSSPTGHYGQPLSPIPSSPTGLYQNQDAGSHP